MIDSQLGNASEIIGLLQRSVNFTIRNPAVSLQFRIHKSSMIQPLLDTGLRYETSQGLFVLDSGR